jgi:hypothetical protein
MRYYETGKGFDPNPRMDRSVTKGIKHYFYSIKIEIYFSITRLNIIDNECNAVKVNYYNSLKRLSVIICFINLKYFTFKCCLL